jgi:hypothetical protein
VVKIGLLKKKGWVDPKIPESDIHWDLLIIEIGRVEILQFVCLVGLPSGELSSGDGTDLVVIDLTYTFHEVLNMD